jgi:hypothetical protein
MHRHERARRRWSLHHPVSRRHFLGGMAALSVTAATARFPSWTWAAESGQGLHGRELRGMYLTASDRLAEGRFGAMFKRLPAFAPPDELLTALSSTMVEEASIPDESFLNTSPRLFAGFTFIGQFIDHDITFDDTPLELQQSDPDARWNFRTPRYDLDSLYGGGPVGSPDLYDSADPDKLALPLNQHGVEDVPRTTEGRALIPDSRNDENLIVVQLHRGIARFHNSLVDLLRSEGLRSEWVFETARRLARWHYQWAVIHDFLPRIVGDALVGPTRSVYRERPGQAPLINLGYYRPTNREDRPFMPIEFAVAAYRFGHSMVRPVYIINDATNAAGGLPVFGAVPGFNLNGGRPVPADLVIDWKNVLPVDPTFAARKPRKIDTRLSPPLASLPASVVPPPDPTVHLAARNHIRGKRVGLASGQQIAKAMRLTPLTNAKLGLSSDSRWKGEAPLWYYVLKEAELAPNNGERLGAVGGRIVAEVLVGLLQRDSTSYLYLDPAWKPAPPIGPATGSFGFVDMLRFAGVA